MSENNVPLTAFEALQGIRREIGDDHKFFEIVANETLDHIEYLLTHLPSDPEYKQLLSIFVNSVISMFDKYIFSDVHPQKTSFAAKPSKPSSKPPKKRTPDT